jgi:hypothetical protein
MEKNDGGADWYVYTGEGKDAIAIAKNGVGPNGGWVGITVATMGVPNKQKTRQEINDWASLIVRSVNAHSKLVELLERALPFIDDAADAHSVMSETCLAKECLQVVADIKAALASAKGMTE